MTLTIEQLTPVMATVASIVALIALIWSLILHHRLNQLLNKSSVLPSSENTSGISAILSAQTMTLERTAAQAETLTEQVNQILETIPRAFQRIGFVRFNPFGDTGSDQSFSIALLNGRDEGLVLSGLYSRGGMRIYAKPVAGARSEYTLSDEEQQAISQALAN
jgi:hypothetical protein